MRSLDQIRADIAYREAARLASNTDFLGLARELSAMLHTNGLLATWAFLCAKNHQSFMEILVVRLRSRVSAAVPENTTSADLFRRWVGADNADLALTGPQLRDLTDEAIAFSGWLKRAAEAYGGGE